MFHWNDGPTLPLKASGREQLRGVLGRVAQRAGDRNVGIQGGLGDADLLGLGRGSAFGVRTSGRRSSNCAGMPTTTSLGTVGIGRCPSRACRSVGGMPNNVQSWSWLCRRVISKAGIVASVCESVVCCWSTSSSVTVPALKRAWTIFSTSRCSFTFCLASSIRSWVWRMVT